MKFIVGFVAFATVTQALSVNYVVPNAGLVQRQDAPMETTAPDASAATPAPKAKGKEKGKKSGSAAAAAAPPARNGYVWMLVYQLTFITDMPYRTSPSPPPPAAAAAAAGKNGLVLP